MNRDRPASSSQIFLARCLVTGLMLVAAMLSFSFFSRDADAAEKDYYYAYTSIDGREVRDILVFDGLSEALQTFGNVTAMLIVPGQFEAKLSGGIRNECPRSWCTATTLYLEGEVEENGKSYGVKYVLGTIYPDYSDKEVSFSGDLSLEDGTVIGSVHAVPVAASEVELP